MPCRVDLSARPRACRHTRRVGRRRTLAAALATAVTVGACGRPAPMATPPRGTAVAPVVRAVPVDVADTPTEQDPYSRWLAHALLVPLLDDAEPPRWRDPVTWADCDPATQVLLDGGPLPIGAPVPDRPFTLHWRAIACRPLGDPGPLFDADLTVQVAHPGGDNWVLQVDADRIVWHDGQRQVRRSGRLDARMPQAPTPTARLHARAGAGTASMRP